jgi:hypothetical protein
MKTKKYGTTDTGVWHHSKWAAIRSAGKGAESGHSFSLWSLQDGNRENSRAGVVLKPN